MDTILNFFQDVMATAFDQPFWIGFPASLAIFTAACVVGSLFLCVAWWASERLFGKYGAAIVILTPIAGWIIYCLYRVAIAYQPGAWP